MALGKAQGVTPLEAETAVNKFWVNNYAALVDEIKEKLGDEEGRNLPQSYELEVEELTADSARLRITQCPWATLFREKGKEDTGLLFCEVDYDMIKDFNEITGANIVFERTKVLMDGCDHCNHHIFVKK